MSFLRPAKGSAATRITLSPVSGSVMASSLVPSRSWGSNSSQRALTTPYCLSAHRAATLNFLQDSSSSEAIHQFISRRNCRHSAGLPDHVGTRYQELVPDSSAEVIFTAKMAKNKSEAAARCSRSSASSEALQRKGGLRPKVKLRNDGRAQSKRWVYVPSKVTPTRHCSAARAQ